MQICMNIDGDDAISEFQVNFYFLWLNMLQSSQLLTNMNSIDYWYSITANNIKNCSNHSPNIYQKMSRCSMNFNQSKHKYKKWATKARKK